MTPKPFWLAAFALALPYAAPAARAAEADLPTLPKCLAHTKALCFWHTPACLALDMAAACLPVKVEYAATADYPRPVGYSCSAAQACPTGYVASPACSCVPAGAPMSSWATGTRWQAPVLPPPIAVGTPTPCPAAPMPPPVAGCFPGTTPAAAPMTVCAEPMQLGYAPCCATSGPAARNYVVEMKWTRAGGPAGRALETTHRCLTAEGAPVQVGAYGAPDHPDQCASILCVCLERVGKNKVGLEMNFECCGRACKCGKDGEWVQCDCAHVCRTVAVGKPTHVVLRKAAGGAEEAWVEVTVTEAPHAVPERIGKAPRPVPTACPAAGVVNAVGEVCGMTLPSGRYLQHPPQYCPPSPAFPLTRELATQNDAVWMAPPPVPHPAMMMPPPMPPQFMAVPVPAPSRPAAGSVVRAVRTEGKSYLEVRAAGAPCIQCKSMVLEPPHGDAVKLSAGNGRVVVRGPDMKAWADSVRTAGRQRIVLEGNVRLVSHHDGHETRIKADVLEVRLEDEHVEVSPSVDAE